MSGELKLLQKMIVKNLKSRKSVYLLVILLLLSYYSYLFKPIMWIVAEKNERELEEIVQNLTKNATTDLEKAQRIYEWFSSGNNLVNVYWRKNEVIWAIPPLFLYKTPPHVCIRLVGHDYPLWVLTSRCGACEEYALLFMEMADKAGLKVRSIHNHGENHNWDEVYIDGEWIVVDPSWPKFNETPRFYEYGRGLNISYVYALYPNGSIEDVTTRYTDTGIVNVKVVDTTGNSIKGAVVEVISNNYKPNWRVVLTCHTNDAGECSFRIGGGNYTLKTYAKLFLSNKTNIIVEEGTQTNITITPTRDIGASIIRYPLVFTVLFWLMLNVLVAEIKWIMRILKTQ